MMRALIIAAVMLMGPCVPVLALAQTSGQAGATQRFVLKSGSTMTGPLLLPLGTTAAPGVAFTGNTGTGLSFDGDLNFSIGGTHELYLDNLTLSFVGVYPNLLGKHIADSIGALQLGSVCTNGSGGGMCTGGKLALTVGAVGAPAFYLGTETATGFYRSGTNQWGFASNGAQTFKVGSYFAMASGKTFYMSGGALSDLAGPLHVGSVTSSTHSLTTSNDVIVTGKLEADGAVFLDGGLTVASSFVPPVVLDISPAEPHACNASYEGAVVYVDDADDTSWAEMCFCANLDGTGYDWRQVANTGVACSHF